MGSRPTETRIALDMWRAQREGAAGLQRRREARLAALVDHARSRSNFYRDRFRGVADGNHALGDLPPVSKPELMDSFDDWVTDPRVDRQAVERFVSDASLVGTAFRNDFLVCTSSGTTGHPGLYVCDSTAIAVYRAMVIARMDRAWLSAGQWLGLARRGVRLAAVVGTGGHFAGELWMESERRSSAWRRRAYRLLSVQSPLPELVASLNTFDPAILTTYPSALELLVGEQSAGRLRLAPTFIEVSGESLSATTRRRAQAAFGCPIHDVFAAAEFWAIAIECEQEWLHVNSDWVILEPVGPDLNPTPPGEPSHTVLLTNLANRVQPLIRYDLGDSVLARPDPCPCGNPLPAIRVAGRCDDVLRLLAADGHAVSVLPLAIGSVADETPGLLRSQLVQSGPSEVTVRVALRPGSQADTVWAALSPNLLTWLASQGLANVRLIRSAQAPERSATSGKFRQVIGSPPTH